MPEQITLALKTDDLSYFAKRMALLGIKPEHNTIDLWQGAWETKIGEFDGKEYREAINELKPFPIFREVEKGIEILVYTLQRSKVVTTKDAQRSGHTIKARDKDYTITRLEKPIVKADGKVIKYLMPKGEPTRPHFHPALVKKYEDKTKIAALYLTEGYFKGFKACMHGIDCVAVPSITCLRDKETNMLHGDILDLIERCNVERLIWLTDGDFMNITGDEITDQKDLYTRPAGFYDSCYTFYNLTSQLKDVDRFFAHINTELLTVPAETRGSKKDGDFSIVTPERPGPKGLDDLLCAYPDKLHDIAMEFNNFSIMAPGKVYPGTYITRMNICTGTGRVRSYMQIDDVTKFYLWHRERRPDMMSVTKFKFNGTLYNYNEAEGKCTIEIPKKASDYVRVGNDYFEIIEVPTKDYKSIGNNPNNTRIELAPRMKGTIVDDNGKDIFKHIQKYHKFVVVPDHMNFQPFIHNCYNVYKPFLHEPDEGDCSITLEYLKHVFGEEKITLTDAGTLDRIYTGYELALDYLTILYKYPQQMLPILCLVSNERQTGKTTLLKWLTKIFIGNVITVGNEDIKSDFNAHWITKLVVGCDETKIDKDEVIEKIKRLSTSDEAVMNNKGVAHVTVDFFTKFILTANDEEGFIRIDKEEIRFWVKKVPQLKKVNTHILDDMVAEIPAFLHFINTRQMVSENVERHWFDTRLLETQALQKVKLNSLTGVEKRLMLEIAELFEALPDHWPDTNTLCLPLEYIQKDLIKHNDKTYVKRILNKMGYTADNNGRIEYPVRERMPTEGGKGYITKLLPTEHHGRYYKFERAAFTDIIGTAIIAETGAAAEPIQTDLPF